MKTKDPFNQPLSDVYEEVGSQTFELITNSVWLEHPRRLVFALSRYKFISKMLTGLSNVAGVGCGDGFVAGIVKKSINNLTITDYYEAVHTAYAPMAHYVICPCSSLIETNK